MHYVTHVKCQVKQEYLKKKKNLKNNCMNKTTIWWTCSLVGLLQWSKKIERK